MRATAARSSEFVDLCDSLGLRQRLAETPADANVRGLFFKLAEDAVRAADPRLLGAWRAMTGARARWPFRLYSTRDFLFEQAAAAVLLDSENPARALDMMWRDTPKLSPMIRAERFMLHLVENDPLRAFRWLENNRRLMCDYGRWWLEPAGSNEMLFHYQDEYVWIDSAHRGGVEGTLSRCGVSAVVTAELESPYSGCLRIRWD